jgi:membrane carboxypeptidase/penicillin-binding protein PbpC
MHNISGVSGCGPLFKDIMLLMENRKPEARFAEAEDVTRVKICPLSGRLASEYCPGTMDEIFIEGTEPSEHCQVHTGDGRREASSEPRGADEFAIAFPHDGDTFKMDPVLRVDFQRIKFKATIPAHMDVDVVEWWVNDRRIGVSAYPYAVYWHLKPGNYTIRAAAVNTERILKSPPVAIRVD